MILPASLTTAYNTVSYILSFPFIQPMICSTIDYEIKARGSYIKVIVSPLLGLFNKADPTALMINELQDLFNGTQSISDDQAVVLDKIQVEVTGCAAKMNVTIDDANKFVNCTLTMISSQSDEATNIVDLAFCIEIGPENLTKKLSEIKLLATCISQDLKASEDHARTVSLQLKREMADISASISKFHNFNILKTQLQSHPEIVADCSHIIGNDIDVASNKIDCFIEMASIAKGISQKLQSFIKCDNLNVDNASDEIANALVLIQCIDNELNTLGIVGVNVDGSVT